jgi:regulatory protein
VASKSLRARAIDALSRREHSRNELASKLAPYAEDRDKLEALLDTLERENLLSNARFAESLTHRREERFGTRRVLLELERHGVSAETVAQQRAVLERTELERCKTAWEKKFGTLPASFEERARQTRFLESRGFDHESIRRVLSARVD